MAGGNSVTRTVRSETAARSTQHAALVHKPGCVDNASLREIILNAF